MKLYAFYINRHKKTMQQLRCIGYFLLVISILLVSSIMFIKNETALSCALFGAGWFTWTFTEYIAHRFWMHGRRNAGSAHSHHHAHPTEIHITPVQRIMFFLVVALLTVAAYYVSAYLFILDGFVFGFAGYCCMHWVLHQNWSRKLFPRLHRFHIHHHCKYPNSCFGVTVTWWDLLFRTVPPGQAVVSEKVLAFYYGDD